MKRAHDRNAPACAAIAASVFVALLTVPDVRGAPDAIAWERAIRVASGEAHRGEWRQNDSDYRWVDDPAVSIANDGSVALAWIDQSRKDVFFQGFGRDGKPTLPAAVNVSRSGSTLTWLPRVLVAPGDPRQVFVLWQEIVFSGGSHGGEIFFARSSDGGRTFDAPVNLSNSPAGDGKGRLSEKVWDNGSLDLARTEGGAIIAAWTEYEGALWVRRSNDGKTFEPALRLSGDAKAPARAPSLATGPNDAAYVAWTVGEQGSADIHVARSSDGGKTFAAPRVVATTEGHSDAPRLAVDRQGTVHAVWAERTKGPAYEVRYARWKGEWFEPSRALPRGDKESAQFPKVATDQTGKVYVLWERYGLEGSRASGLSFTVSPDGGQQFVAPMAVPEIAGGALGTNGGEQGMLAQKLAVARDGTIAIANSTFRASPPSPASHVWLIRGRLRAGK
ncbi:MAG: exo-alpha-sialidase [Deltaproteobacteria bacterium]|nr:exo-alpha-sialidase [Deltaproteobacteria bacterium]